MADLRTRKSFYSLNRSEKDEFIEAVLALKADGGYDDLVLVHQQAMMNSTPWSGDTGESNRNSAHRGPAFLPWHRQYLQVYERELQRVSGNPNLSIPYWNWLADGRLSDPRVAPLWKSNGVGGDGNPGFNEVKEDFPFTVTDGPFERWPTIHDTGGPPDVLRRHLGVMVPNLPTTADSQSMMQIDQYDTEPWDDTRTLPTFRNAIEGWFTMPEGSRMHNQVHVWVGGSMLPGTSPNDPVFYMHHCFVDRLWADWQRLQQSIGRSDLAESYQPQSGGPEGHNIDDPMFPWNSGDEVVTPRNVLEHRSLGFCYDNEPTAEVDMARAPAQRNQTVNSECFID